MRASNKLEKCTEICKYNSTGICAFGLRYMGCFLDEEIQQEAERIFLRAKEINTISSIKTLYRE